jgi:hypothetical protein
MQLLQNTLYKLSLLKHWKVSFNDNNFYWDHEEHNIGNSFIFISICIK